jgi:hypothetical protein
LQVYASGGSKTIKPRLHQELRLAFVEIFVREAMGLPHIEPDRVPGSSHRGFSFLGWQVWPYQTVPDAGAY